MDRWVGLYLLRYNSHHMWPHPDAGSIVASYMGRGGVIHHKLLALDALFK